MHAISHSAARADYQERNRSVSLTPGSYSDQRVARVLEVEQVAELLSNRDVLLVDVRSPEQCIDGHIPGAVLLPYDKLIRSDGIADGLAPYSQDLSATLSTIGLQEHSHVIAYDDDNGSRASRLLWLLDSIGHYNHSLLNGGFAPRDFDDQPITKRPSVAAVSNYQASYLPGAWMELEDIVQRLHSPDVVLLDVRSAAEFSGEDLRAKRGGHIPGAINLEWSTATDHLDNGRLLNAEGLRDLFLSHDVGPEKEIIVYCQTHHRSSHTFLALKHLGYPRVTVYPGSWSEWGNRSDTPISVI